MAEYMGGGAAAVVVGRGGRECAATSEDEEAESGSTGGGCTPGSAAGRVQRSAATTAAATMGTIDVARKPRGRPPGSKNKPKPPIVITRDAENAMRPHVLELAAGCDVVESVARFAQRHHLGLCVISGRGTVANVSLHNSTAVASSGRSPAGSMTFHGRFDILSLSGIYLLPSSPSPPLPPPLSPSPSPEPRARSSVEPSPAVWWLPAPWSSLQLRSTTPLSTGCRRMTMNQATPGQVVEVVVTALRRPMRR